MCKCVLRFCKKWGTRPHVRRGLFTFTQMKKVHSSIYHPSTSQRTQIRSPRLHITLQLATLVKLAGPTEIDSGRGRWRRLYLLLRITTWSLETTNWNVSLKIHEKHFMQKNFGCVSFYLLHIYINRICANVQCVMVFWDCSNFLLLVIF